MDVAMPKLSESMEEGTILRWLKQDGEHVAEGEELVEIETDKATVAYAAETSGAMQIVVPEGSTVPVGEVVARIGAAVGEAAGSASSPEERTAASVALADVPTPPPADVAAPLSSASPSLAQGADANGGTRADGTAAASRAIATPLARRAARAHGIDLEQLEGSGPRGRITRGDVLAAAGVTEEPRPAAAAPPPAPAAPPPAADGPAPSISEDFEIQEPTRVQRLIARRMAEAKATIPDFEVEVDVVMDRALVMRAELKQLEGPETTPSVNDFVIKACAVALRRHPRVNASYVDGSFKLHRRINVGVAVASEDGLIVPVVRDADTKSLGAIANETRGLAMRVRAGEITPPELSGGTFTVSNLGMFGMSAIRPVINLPQAAIMGVGAIRETLGRVGGEIVDRRLMTLSLSADHRILYGADAARFVADVKALLESPLTLTL